MTSPRPRRRRTTTPRWARGAALLLPVLIAAGTAPALAAEPAVLSPAGAHDSPAATTPLTPSGFEAGTYVVVLRDPAAADYRGGVPGLRSTTLDGSFAPRSARTRAYTAHLAEAQDEVAASVDVTPLASYALATNGFAARLSATQAARLSTDPRVRDVVASEVVHVQDATTSTGYLGLEGEDGVWEGIGGPAAAGRGIVVGVIDTGIAPENPSFAGAALGTADGVEPFRDGGAIVFHKSDGSDFRGVCQAGEQFTAQDCTQKVVGARYFVDGFGTANLGSAEVGEYVSPRDGASHGSHTASTAAGDVDVATPGGPRVSGVTPAARIAAYKACWSGPDPASEDDDGCATPDLLAAIDAAVGDNVDVINYSIGGGAAETTNSLTDQAFKAAATAGIFVAAAGGNSGPGASTLDNAAPWVTTVAASTFPAPEATVTLGDGGTAVGASVTVPAAGVSGRFVDAADVGTGTDAALCGTGTLDPAKAAGTVVLCERGVVARVEKSAEVERAGGIGMVLVNAVPDSTDVDAHAVPTVHVDARYAARLHSYAGTAGATVSLVPGNSTGEPSAATPQVAGFSSRGPVEADGSDLVKPDLAAPGVNVLAATANAAGAAPAWGYMSGTSMASPHVAGLAALYLSTRPDATPAEIKSALMTSATDTVDADGTPAPDPFAQGNGQVVPRSYLDPGLLYLNDPDDWEGYLAGIGEPTSSTVDPIDGSDLNLASIGVGSLAGRQVVTRTVTATRPGTYTAEVTGLAGIEAIVEPATLDVAEAGEQHTFTVTFLRQDAPLGEFSTGYLDWTDGDTTVRSSLAVRPVAFDAPSEVPGSGTTGSVDLTAHVGDAAAVDLTTEGLAHGSSVSGTGTQGGHPHRYAVTVPEGASFARFDLDAADDTGDLDLAVYRVDDASQNVWFVDGSMTDSADERVDLSAPIPGTYVVETVFYRGGGTGPDLDYTLTSYVVDPASGTGGFRVTPDSLEAEVGDTPTVTASWSDLAPGPYLGIVRFGDTGARTVVTVDAGSDTPVQPGTPTLTLTPDAGTWVARNSDLRVTATGLTPGATYAASVGDGTLLRTGRAPADGRIDWMVTMTADVPTGSNTLTLTGPGTELTAPFRLTPVGVTDAYVAPMTAFDGQVHARLEISYAGYGDLRYRLQSADGSRVYVDQTAHVEGFEGATVWNYTGPWFAVGSEDLVGVITPVLPDGSEGPGYTTPVSTPDPVEPGTISFTPTTADPDVVRVDLVNRNPYSTYPVMVRYRGCDGRYVVGWDSIDLDASTQEWDLTGFTQVEVVDQFGARLASYRHEGPGRCDAAGISVGQDYWATLSATPPTAPGYDPARPITLEVSNRYGPRSTGFDLNIGEGATRNAEKPFFSEVIGVEMVDERGPVVSRSVQVRAGVPHWAASDWEEYDDPILYFRTSWLEIPALSLPDLAPVTEDPGPGGTPITAGSPAVSGRPVVGRTLRADAGTWAPADVALGYQWLRDGTAIPGATGRSYRLRPADGGHALAVRVTGSLPGAAAVTRTSAAGTVLNRLRATPRPRLVGPATLRRVLTVRTGVWTPKPVRLSVTWLRDGQVIRGAHGLRHRLTAADRGHRITVVVTGRRAGYAEVSRTSRAVRVR